MSAGLVVLDISQKIAKIRRSAALNQSLVNPSPPARERGSRTVSWTSMALERALISSRMQCWGRWIIIQSSLIQNPEILADLACHLVSLKRATCTQGHKLVCNRDKVHIKNKIQWVVIETNPRGSDRMIKAEVCHIRWWASRRRMLVCIWVGSAKPANQSKASISIVLRIK